MAPLSHDLAGIILPHDTFGDHLDGNGNTIDQELEEKNFYAAADALSEIWSRTVIDKHPVYCETVKKGSQFIPNEPCPKWVATHVRVKVTNTKIKYKTLPLFKNTILINFQQSRYSLQIVKCLNEHCCEKYETNWRQLFPEGFLPPPAIYQFGKTGLEIVEPSVYFKDQENFTNQRKYKFATLQERLITNLKSIEAGKSSEGIPRPIPFDSYCPSMKDKLDDCVCEKCGIAWPSAAAKNRHKKAHEKRMNIFTETTMEYQEVEDEFANNDINSSLESVLEVPMPIIGTALNMHLVSPFEECKDEISQ